MDGTDGVELTLLIVCILIYGGYHGYLYFKTDELTGGSPSGWFSVYGTMGTAKQLWSVAIAEEEKEAVTGVQTYRSAILILGLMASMGTMVAGRQIPQLLLDSSYASFETLGEIDPITGGPGRKGFISAVGKLVTALGLIWACVLCLCQAGRFFVHLGFIIKVVHSKHNTENWQIMEECLAVTHQAHMYFSLSWRIFYAFGLAILYLPGITSLLISTICLTVMLYFSDHLHRTPYSAAVGRMKRSGRIGRPPSRQLEDV